MRACLQRLLGVGRGRDLTVAEDLLFTKHMLTSDLCSLIGSSWQSSIEGLDPFLIVEQRGRVACMMLYSK